MSDPYALHPLAICFWKRGRPCGLIAGLGKHMTEFGHLRRRQFGDVDPYVAVRYARRARDLTQERRQQCSLVGGTSASPNVAMDENLIALERRTPDEIVAGLDLVEDHLREIERRSGDLVVSTSDRRCDLALLVGRQTPLGNDDVIGGHPAPLPGGFEPGRARRSRSSVPDPSRWEGYTCA